MTETDASVIAREMDALKASFSYRSLQRDIDLVFANLDRAMFAEASGRSIQSAPISSSTAITSKAHSSRLSAPTAANRFGFRPGSIAS